MVYVTFGLHKVNLDAEFGRKEFLRVTGLCGFVQPQHLWTVLELQGSRAVQGHAHYLGQTSPARMFVSRKTDSISFALKQ